MSTPSERPRPIDGVWGRDLGDEYVFYEQDGDKVHVLNGTAREIFLLLDGERTLEDVVAALGRRYDVDDETLARDVADTVAHLRRLRLLRD